MEGIVKKSENTQEGSHLEKLKNIIEFEKSNIILVFHRHLEHDTKDGEVDELHKLTKDDLAYAEDISELLKNTDLLVAFTVDNLRSYLTSYFLLDKEGLINAEGQDQISLYNQSRDNTKIQPLKELNYRDPINTKFNDGLEQSFKDGRPLEFLIHESDGFNLEGENISGYSLVASEVAEIIHKYFKIRDKWKNLSNLKYNSENLLRAFCAREFIYACFRAKLTEKIKGLDEREKFIKWFAEKKNTKGITIVTFKDTDTIVLTDNFGELTFDVSLLLEIIGENPIKTKTNGENTNE